MDTEQLLSARKPLLKRLKARLCNPRTWLVLVRALRLIAEGAKHLDKLVEIVTSWMS